MSRKSTDSKEKMFNVATSLPESYRRKLESACQIPNSRFTVSPAEVCRVILMDELDRLASERAKAEAAPMPTIATIFAEHPEGFVVDTTRPPEPQGDKPVNLPHSGSKPASTGKKAAK